MFIKVNRYVQVTKCLHFNIQTVTIHWNERKWIVFSYTEVAHGICIGLIRVWLCRQTDWQPPRTI